MNKWFTDNKNVVQISKCGNRKAELQGQVLEVFNTCFSRGSLLKWNGSIEPKMNNPTLSVRFKIQITGDFHLRSFMKSNAVGVLTLSIALLILGTRNFRDLTHYHGILELKTLKITV